MANKNKVEFGLSNVHIGTYEYDIAAGTVTLGDPMTVPGAVSLSLDVDTEDYKFYADDVVYYSSITDNGESGELTMANFPDEFKLNFLPYKKLEDGGLAKIKGERAKDVYIAFEGKGDKHKRRHILFNVALGAIKREHKTIEGSEEVEVETIGVTLTGDTKSGVVKISYSEDDAGYETVFTKPAISKVAESPGV